MEEQEMNLGPQNKIETLEYDVKLLGEKLEEAWYQFDRLQEAVIDLLDNLSYVEKYHLEPYSSRLAKLVGIANSQGYQFQED